MSDWRRENRGKSQERHGKRYLPEYQIWLQMKGRCQNPRNKRYCYYGERGIKVCQRWSESFQAFYDDMGARPSPEMTLERKDTNGDYCPDNCIWDTKLKQSRNRRHVKRYTYKGKTLYLSEWSEELGISLETLEARINAYKWTVERALSSPVGAPRSTSRFLTYDGVTLPMADMARKYGISPKTFKNRMYQGWTIERIVSTPVPS